MNSVVLPLATQLQSSFLLLPELVHSHAEEAWVASSYPFLQPLTLLQSECVSFCDDRHNIHFIVYCFHKCNI